MVQIQYPQLAEPFTSAVIQSPVLVTEWLSVVSQPTYARSVPTNLPDGPEYGVDVSHFPETNFPDKWWRQASEPTRLPVRPPDSQYQAPLEPSLIVPVKDVRWWPTLSQPVLPPVRAQQGLFEIPLEPSLIIQLSDVRWWPVASTPVLPAVRAQQGLSVLPPEPTEILQPDLDHWWRQASEPVLPLVRAQQGLFVLAAEPTTLLQPSLAQWWRPGPEPVVRHVAGQPGHFTAPLEPSLVLLPPGLSWWVQPVEVPRSYRQPLQLTPFRRILDSDSANEIITVDKWWRPASEPVRPPLRVAESMHFAILEPTLFTAPPLLSWHQAVAAPITRPSYKQYTNSSDVFVQPVPRLSWSSQTQELPLRPLNRQYEAFTQPLVVTVAPPMSGWWILPEEPSTFRQWPLLETWPMMITPGRPPVPPPPLSWWCDISQPVRRPWLVLVDIMGRVISFAPPGVQATPISPIRITRPRLPLPVPTSMVSEFEVGRGTGGSFAEKGDVTPIDVIPSRRD